MNLVKKLNKQLRYLKPYYELRKKKITYEDLIVAIVNEKVYRLQQAKAYVEDCEKRRKEQSESDDWHS
jgi:hypothetical protein